MLSAAEAAAGAGRWVAGFVTYEAATGLDATLENTAWPAGHPMATLPLAWFATFRHRRDLPALAPVPGKPGKPDKPDKPDEAGEPGEPGEAGWILQRDQAWHRHAVAQVQSLIAAGDLYQLNLTARLSGLVHDPRRLYRRMVAAQRGAYSALLTTPTHTVVSASPELFFRWDGDHITTRPMKGTAPRGRSSDEDVSAGQRLARSDKDRAENVMIVDLVRNDLGRIAVPGSVEVPALWTTERYPAMWQLTSTVGAAVDPGIGLLDVFRAVFPCGSVTGAPKRRTMAAIAQIEGQPRGVYCGAVGYLRPGGARPAARFSVAIRTVTVVTATGYAEYGAGGGITALSDPKTEWAEILTKTSLLRAHPVPAGLLETFRAVPGRGAVHLREHLSRLRESAAYFGFPYDEVSIRTAIDESVCSARTNCRVRLVLRPDGGVEVRAEPLRLVEGPVRLGLAGEAVDSSDVLLFHKHSDRSMYDAFRRQAAGVDDVVLWNEAHQVTETTIANLLVEIDGQWWTPPVACGLLPGVGRRLLLERGEVRERALLVDDLRAATGLAVVSSLRGRRPAVM